MPDDNIAEWVEDALLEFNESGEDILPELEQLLGKFAAAIVELDARTARLDQRTDPNVI